MSHRHSERWLLTAMAAEICTVSLLTAAIADDGAPRATLSASQVRSGISQAQARIVAFRITYEITYPSEEGWPLGGYLRRTTAAKSPHFFFHETAHGHNALPWQDDPRLRRCYIVGDHASDEWVNYRSYNHTQLLPSEGLPGSMPDESLVHATGMWPLDGRPAPRFEDRPIVLREIAENEKYKVVRSLQEQCDGRWCHVLEYPGRDCLWIDAHRGFALMAKETRDTNFGHLIERIELGGHREIKPEIWLPTWIRNIQYDFKAKTPEGRQQKVIDSKLKLLTVQINEDVSADVFRFVPPAGALWLNPPGGEPVQTSPGGEEHLDHLVEWARKYGPSERLQASTTAKVLPFGCALVALVLLEGLLQVLRRRTKRQP